MAVCSLSMAATATTLFSSFSSSLVYLFRPTINLSFKPNPINTPKLRTHFTKFPTVSHFSHSVTASAVAFNGANETTQEDDTQNVESSQEEDEDDVEEEEVEEEEVVESVVVSEERRLYVGNLPYSMTSTQLADLFAQAGHTLSVEVIYDKVTNRSRGFAFVTMGSLEEAKEAIRMFEGSQAGGRTMKVNFPEVPKGGEREVMGPKIRSEYQGFVDSPHKIYAGNLSWSVTSQGLKEVFANQSGLLSAKVIFERDTGRSRGFGFITFSSAEDVESALNSMNGVEVEGRPMRLNLSDRKSSLITPPIAESENSDVLSANIAE